MQRDDEVADDQHDTHDEHHHRHAVGDGEKLGDVDVAGVGTPVELRDTAADRLVEGTGDVPTVEQMGGLAKQSAVALATLPVKVWGVGQAIVGVKDRAVDSPVSIVGGGRIAGETASADGFPLRDKMIGLLGLVAGFNFFIGLFNFIPLLPLDGGHIAGALWEAARRGIARLRGRPDPGYVDVARLLPVAYVVASFLLVMGVVLIVGDLVVPVSIT